ncbi:MAG: hypothetical protein V4474_03965 [Patescibacteria group bacterium]
MRLAAIAVLLVATALPASAQDNFNGIACDYQSDLDTIVTKYEHNGYEKAAAYFLALMGMGRCRGTTLQTDLFRKVRDTSSGRPLYAMRLK